MAVLRGQRDFFPGAGFGADFRAGRFKLGRKQVRSFLSLPGSSFTRASVGYAETAGGILVPFAFGAPRITDKGLLVEEARTNLLLRSQEFDNASWTKAFSTVTANSTTAPDGTSTADSLIEDTTTNQHRTSQAVTVSNTTAYTFSVYAKANTRLGVYLRIITATTVAQAAFNLQTGAINSNASGSATITALANGWYRCTVTGTTDGTTATCYANLQSTASEAGIGSYTGDGTSGLYVWGAQLEAGAFATSYIPTTTASATRAADVAYIPFVPTFPLTIVSAAVLGAADASGSTFVQIYDGTNNNRIATYTPTVSANALVIVSGGIEANVARSTVTGGVAFKHAGRFGTNDVAGCLNGGAVATDTLAAMPAGCIRLGIGQANGFALANGYIKQAIVYPYAFTDAQLQAATA